MKRLTVLVALLVVAGFGLTQVPPPPAPPTPTAPLLPPQPDSMARVPHVQPTPPPPRQMTLDEMLDAMEHLKMAKAEIEQKEKAMAEMIAKKMEKQAERMKKLGLGAKVAEVTDEAVRATGGSR